MMAAPRKWWIRQRRNPQLGTYYVACGQMSQTAANKCERSTLYGSNAMRSYDTEEEYQSRLRELRDSGEDVQ